MQRTVSYRQPKHLRWVLLLGLLGCATVAPGPLGTLDGIPREFLYTPDQNSLISTNPADVADIAAATTRVSVAEIAERRRTQEVRLDQLAWFFRSAQGRDYLTAPSPKALVRGVPEAQCPVNLWTQGADAVGDALRACHSNLAALGREESCDCQVLAHDIVLHAEAARFEYAVDLPVRLFQAGQLDPVTYFSRAGVTPEGDQALAVEVAGTRILIVSYAGPEALEAVVSFADGSQASAIRAPVGYVRGRLRESFTTTTPDGTVLRIIVGP